MNLDVMRWAVSRDSMDYFFLLKPKKFLLNSVSKIILNKCFHTLCLTEAKNLQKLTQSRVAGNIFRMIFLTMSCVSITNDLRQRISITQFINIEQITFESIFNELPQVPVERVNNLLFTSLTSQKSTFWQLNFINFIPHCYLWVQSNFNFYLVHEKENINRLIYT